jgi:hypothetical protein
LKKKKVRKMKMVIMEMKKIVKWSIMSYAYSCELWLSLVSEMEWTNLKHLGQNLDKKLLKILSEIKFVVPFCFVFWNGMRYTGRNGAKLIALLCGLWL